MSTLMRNGRRRCDAVCHRAIGDSKKCGCICNGKFHGSALTRPAELEQAKVHFTVVDQMLDDAQQPGFDFEITAKDILSEIRKDK